MTFPRLNSGPRLRVLSFSPGDLVLKETCCSISFKSQSVVDGYLMDLRLKRDRFPGNVLVEMVGCVDFWKDFTFLFTVLGGFC